MTLVEGSIMVDFFWHFFSWAELL